ncbi:MAG: hypothetical protein JWP29_3068, partial [Rhodoferax sp.]|nr:hypothetical protein [Rhodoferax sp.]
MSSGLTTKFIEIRNVDQTFKTP